MSDVKTPQVIRINNRADFRKAAQPFGINVGERGRLPYSDFGLAILPGVASGDIIVEDTPFFSLAIAAGKAKASASDVEISYTITYRVLNSKTGKPMPGDKTLTVTTNEIKSYLPHLNARGVLSASTALMVVAVAKAKDGALLTDLQKYVITKVAKVETSSTSDKAAEGTEQPADTEDTSDSSTDADKPSDEHASEEMINAAIEAGEQSQELVNA